MAYIPWEFVQAEVDEALANLPEGKKVKLKIESHDGLHDSKGVKSFNIKIVDKDGDE